MEPDERSGQLRGRGERDRPEVGFNSRESLQALEYLKNVQRIQLRMLCVRVSSPWEETTSGTMKVTYYPAMLGPKRVQIAKVSGYFYFMHNKICTYFLPSSDALSTAYNKEGSIGTGTLVFLFVCLFLCVCVPR